MIKVKVLKPAEVTAQIKDGMTVCPIAMTLVSASETILKDIENSSFQL